MQRERLPRSCPGLLERRAAGPGGVRPALARGPSDRVDLDLAARGRDHRRARVGARRVVAVAPESLVNGSHRRHADACFAEVRGDRSALRNAQRALTCFADVFIPSGEITKLVGTETSEQGGR